MEIATNAITGNLTEDQYRAFLFCKGVLGARNNSEVLQSLIKLAVPILAERAKNFKKRTR